MKTTEQETKQSWRELSEAYIEVMEELTTKTQEQ